VPGEAGCKEDSKDSRRELVSIPTHLKTSLRSKNVNNMEAHVNGPTNTHDKDHAGETSEGHDRDHGEQARKEAHQPRGAAPGRQPQAV
jgi:hypothetical protein